MTISRDGLGRNSNLEVALTRSNDVWRTGHSPHVPAPLVEAEMYLPGSRGP
jgi:hypothetical protein